MVLYTVCRKRVSAVRESVVESHLKRLEDCGFRVLKLRTPGTNGVPDRMILAPKWSPGPPSFVELKAPGKFERLLQAGVRDDWRARGVDVRPMCDTPERVRALCLRLIWEAEQRAPKAELPWPRLTYEPEYGQ